VTCGIRSVWEKVLEREGLLATVKVIGGGRLHDAIDSEYHGAYISLMRQPHSKPRIPRSRQPLHIAALGSRNETRARSRGDLWNSIRLGEGP
jgi:hypothetical protein